MEQNTEWTRKYYSEAAQAKIEKRKKLWSPELQERVTEDWNGLFRDIERQSKTEKIQRANGRKHWRRVGKICCLNLPAAIRKSKKA